MTKIVGMCLFVAAVTLLIMHYTGVIAENGQVIGQLETQSNQLHQTVRDNEEQVKKALTRAQKAEALMRDRERSAVENFQKANQLAADIAALRRENEELKRWADITHPDSVRIILATATSGSQDRVSIHPSSRGID
jgi:hypothetical protein